MSIVDRRPEELEFPFGLSKASRAFLLSTTALCLSAGMNSAQAQVAPVPGSNNAVVVVDTQNPPVEPVIRNTTTGWGNAVLVRASGSLTGSNLTIETQGTSTNSGDLSVGVRSIGGIVDLTGGSISATGAAFGRGILAYDGADVTTRGTDIWTLGRSSHAVHALGASTISVNGGTVTTSGEASYGIYAQNAGANIVAEDVALVTSGPLNSFGLFALNGGTIAFNGGSIETSGERGHGAVAGAGSTILLDRTAITTDGFNSWGLVADQANTSIVASDTDIVTNGMRGYGAYASSPDGSSASITLKGGSVRTLNETGRGTQNGDGSRSYALYADGTGASITADGTTIQTLGQRAYGAYATNGASIELDDLGISTEGFMAYGVYASGAGSVITANNVDIVTTGQVGDAAWAYQGGILNLNGGTYIVRGQQNPSASGEVASGLVAVGGSGEDDQGIINANGINVLTTGAGSIGVKAGADIGTSRTSGRINLIDSHVRVEGAGAEAARVLYGSTLTAEGGSLTSLQGTGVRLVDGATVSLDNTTVSAGQETFVSSFVSSGQSQAITLGDGTVATQNNGTLLRVERSEGGVDGVVELTLGAGSTSSGDILDDDDRSDAGGTDVRIEEGASWSGMLRGVRNFFGFEGGEVSFEGEADIAGDLEGDGTSYTFSDQGGTIGGSVTLNNGSSTTGGSIGSPIEVAQDVSVDQTSTLGGNWAIDGDLNSAGTISPGNSIGRVSVGGDLTLASTSRYVVDIDGTGDADRIDVTGTATLDGTVEVTPLGGFLVGQPYTILTAGARTGEFDNVSFSEDYAFLDAGLAYDPNTVYLTIDRNGVAFASVARTGNQAATANALDSLPLTNELATAIALSTAGDAAGARLIWALRTPLIQRCVGYSGIWIACAIGLGST